MTQPQREDGRGAHPLTVTVVRSGGIGGLRRQWRAEPEASDLPRWRTLVSSCPWDDVADERTGADRYVWRIRADEDDTSHEAQVPDAALEGAWRALVDAVRAASGVSRTGSASS